MSKPVLDNKASSSKSSHGDPPELRINCLSMRDVKAKTKDPKDANLPVDVLLLTVKNCEFLACYNELQDPYKCWFDGLGYVFFSHVDQSQEEKVKVALLRCYKNGIGPGGSLISVRNAASKLRPKAVISVGACTGLNPNKTKLGDVIVSAKLTTYQGQSTSLRSCVSRRFLDIIKYSNCGWEAPLKDPAAQEIQVHCDGEFLSGPEEVSAEWRRQQLAELHPDAVAVETEGEGELMLFPLVIFCPFLLSFYISCFYLFSVVFKAFYFEITLVNVCWSKRVRIFQVLGLLFSFHTLQQMLHILSVARLFCFLFNQNNQSNGIWGKGKNPLAKQHNRRHDDLRSQQDLMASGKLFFNYLFVI